MPILTASVFRLLPKRSGNQSHYQRVGTIEINSKSVSGLGFTSLLIVRVHNYVVPAAGVVHLLAH